MGSDDGESFTTRGSDNDKSGVNGAVRFSGAWWFDKVCNYALVNGVYRPHPRRWRQWDGVYRPHPRRGRQWDGVNWSIWLGSRYSLQRTQMKIRPQQKSRSAE